MTRQRGAYTVSLALVVAAASLGAQSLAAPVRGVEHVCSLLSKAEVEKYVTRGREMLGEPSELPGICGYGAGWVQVLVYSGPNAADRFDRLLELFKKDKEPRFPLASLGAEGWVMYPKPDNEYQSIGAFTHARIGAHVVSIFVEADDGKPADSAKADAEALTKLVMSKLH